MILKTILSIVLMATTVHASVLELLPRLDSDDLAEQTQARFDLFSICSNAGRPGAEEEREAVCLELSKALRKRVSLESKRTLIWNLERIGGEESVPILVKFMEHPDERIKEDARRALVVNPSRGAVQALGAQLRNRKACSVRTTAGLIYALGERQQEGASKLVVGALNSPDQDLFIATVKMLGRLNEDVGVQGLLQKRTGEQGFRKMQIDAALLSTKRKAVLSELYASSEDLEVKAAALLGLILGGDTSLAASSMASGDAVQQVAAIEAALQGKDPAVYDAVAQNLGTLPAHVQLQAVSALEFSGNRTYSKAVEPILKSNDVLLQDNASRALARIGTVESIVPLMVNGRADARRALGLLDVEGVGAELEKVAKSSSDSRNRAGAIEVLALRGRRDLIPTFLECAASNDPVVAVAAFKTIGSIGELAQIDPLADLMMEQESSPLSRDALNAMVEIMRRSSNPGEAVGILERKMKGASPRSTVNILQALVQSGSKEALKPIVAACKSSDEALRKQGFKLLGGWNYRNGIPTMLELASDDSISLANHVNLMRGVSRLFAGESAWLIKKEDVQQAIDICRRSEEKAALKATLDQLR